MLQVSVLPDRLAPLALRFRQLPQAITSAGNTSVTTRSGAADGLSLSTVSL